MEEQTGKSSHRVQACFPISVLIDAIKEQYGRDDLNEGNLAEYIEEDFFDFIDEEDTSLLWKNAFTDTEEYARYAAKKQMKKQIGEITHKEHTQAEPVIDLAKMEALMTGPAEVGKLEEEKEGLESVIEGIRHI